MAHLFSSIVFWLALAKRNTALSINTKQPYFSNIRITPPSTGISDATFQAAGPALHSSLNSDNEGVITKSFSYPEGITRNKDHYAFSPKDQLLLQGQHLNIEQIAIATLEEQERDRRLKTKEKWKLQRQELANKHFVEVINPTEMDDKTNPVVKVEQQRVLTLNFVETTSYFYERAEGDKVSKIAEDDKVSRRGTQNEKALNEYKICKIKTDNEEQKEALQLQINTVTEDLGRVSRKLFNARRDHGKLRRELNKVKQNALFDMGKLKKSNKTLKKERDDALEQLATKEAWNLQLQQDTKNLRHDIKELLKQSAKEMSKLSNEWKHQLRVTIEEGEIEKEKIITERDQAHLERDNTEKEKEEIIAQLYQAVLERDKVEREKLDIMAKRNQALLERDTVIKVYEEELSNVQSMLKRCIKIIKFRTRSKYERLETRLPILKSTRFGAVQLFKQAIHREDGKLRLAFAKPTDQRTVRTFKLRNNKFQ